MNRALKCSNGLSNKFTVKRFYLIAIALFGEKYVSIGLFPASYPFILFSKILFNVSKLVQCTFFIFTFIAIEWIRITYLCCWKRPLYQHSHNHCSIISFIVTLPSYCHFPGLFTWNVIRKCLPRANTKGIFLTFAIFVF